MGAGGEAAPGGAPTMSPQAPQGDEASADANIQVAMRILEDTERVAMESAEGQALELGWRLDKHWMRMRDEVPHLTRPPSEYIREHFYVTTQPMEETEDPAHVLDAMGWIGFDSILFASDYPHWDFDDPAMAIPPGLGEDQRRKVFGGNARALYRLD